MEGTVSLEESLAALLSLSPKERITEIVDAYNRAFKETLYQPKTYAGSPIYAHDEDVVVCSEFMYVAKILEVSEMRSPEYQKNIPCYRVRYKGWEKEQPGREWVMEFDITGLHRNCGVVEHLAAHYWNQVLLSENPNISSQKKTGLFKISRNRLASYDAAWRDQCPKPSDLRETSSWTFAKWVGLE